MKNLANTKTVQEGNCNQAMCDVVSTISNTLKLMDKINEMTLKELEAGTIKDYPLKGLNN